MKLGKVSVVAIIGMIIGSFALSAQASKTVYEDNNYTLGTHQERVEDMRVKVLGGYLIVDRYFRIVKLDEEKSVEGYVGISGAYSGFTGNSLRGRGSYPFKPVGITGGTAPINTGPPIEGGLIDLRNAFGKKVNRPVWQFHRKWHDLIFLTKGRWLIDPATAPEDEPAKYIDLNDYIYERVAGTNYFEYEHNGADIRITETETGWRWSKRNGGWIEYDKSGRALRSGDKNNVTINLVRNEAGLIHQYKDHLGNVVVTYTYEGNKPVKVEDYTGRSVVYTWEGDELKNVETTRGQTWIYNYEDVGDHRVLSEKIDPEQQKFLYKYRLSSGGYASVSSSGQSAGGVTVIGCNENGEQAAYQLCSQANSSVSSPAATVSRVKIAVDPTLLFVEKVDHDGKWEKSRYWYNPNSESYTVIESNSDGFERERVYDLDGEVRLSLNGGLLDGSRVRQGNRAVSTDAYGNRTLTTYDRNEAVTSIQHPDGSSQRYEYHPQYNFKILEVDEIGVKTKHEYDDNGNRVKTTYGFESDDERIIEWDYDEYGQVEVERTIGRGDTPTIEVSYEYDDYGNITKLTDARNHVTEFKQYTPEGNYKEMVDGRQKVWKYSYDEQGNQTSETTPLGFITKYEYDSLHRLEKVTDAELRVTIYGYDPRDNKISEINNLGDSQTYKYRYDKKLIKKTDESGQITDFRYDRAGRLISTTDGVGNQIKVIYERGDELAGDRIEQVTSPNNKIRYGYDVRNRRISVSIMSTEAANDSLVNTTVTEYNGRSDVIKIIDGNKNITLYTYTPHQEVLTEINAEDELITYDYDVRGNLKSVTDDKNSQTNYEYDNNDNKTAEVRPMGERQTYTYDANDNQITHTDYQGNVAVYNYDDDSRLVGETNTKAGETDPERLVVYGYDQSNIQTTINDGATNTTYTLDELGRTKEQSTQFIDGNFTKIVKTSYYANDQVKTRTDAENNLTMYTYDDAGKLTSIQIAGAGSIVVDEYIGDLQTKVTYPGGVTRTLVYDGLARLQQIETKTTSNNILLNLEYGFDVVGNITSRIRTGNGITDDQADAFDYDKAYRLTLAEQGNSFPNSGYAYDDNSNRATLTVDEVDTTYTHNINHELEQIIRESITETLAYDDNGAITNRTGGEQESTYTYNSFARIAKIVDASNSDAELASYQYDAYSRRVSKTVGGVTTYFLYTKVGLCGEYDETGNLIRGYVYQPEGYFTTDPVAQKTPSGENYIYSYYQNDHLATPQMMVKASGEVVWQGEYDAFGQVNETVTKQVNPLRFPGQYQDEETGLYYNWNRFYAPELGRYVTSDPIGLHGGINTYAYAYQNPNIYADSSGEVGFLVPFVSCMMLCMAEEMMMNPSPPGPSTSCMSLGSCALTCRPFLIPKWIPRIPKFPKPKGLPRPKKPPEKQLPPKKKRPDYRKKKRKEQRDSRRRNRNKK